MHSEVNLLIQNIIVQDQDGQNNIMICLKKYNLNSKEKFEPGLEFEPRTSRSLAWHSYYLSYPGSIDSTGLNFSPQSNAMQGIVVCDTICHHLTGELTLSLFLYSQVLNQIDKYNL